MSCNKDVQAHKSAWCFAGVKNESELNLAREGIFYMSAKDINALKIWPFHRSELGEGARIYTFTVPNDCRDISPDFSRNRESCTGSGRHNRYKKRFGLCDFTVQTMHKFLESAFTAFNKPGRVQTRLHRWARWNFCLAGLKRAMKWFWMKQFFTVAVLFF